MTGWWLVLGLMIVERLAELGLSARNARWSFARGGIEQGRAHYPVMVVLHIALLLGCAVEPMLRPTPPPPVLTAVACGVVLLAQGLRWWTIATLGTRWNTRVIVVPGLPLVAGGPFRWLRHPNYLAVVVEGVALPVAGGAWLTAGVFTVLNLLLLRVRIRVEEEALDLLPRAGRAE